MIYTLIDFILEEKTYDNLTLGIFDGVHLGHKKLINTMSKGKNLIITFNKNPKTILEVDEKVYELQKLNKDNDILSISLNGMNQFTSPEKFVKFLKKLKIKNIFVGKDFKFGYNKSGDINKLKDHFNVEVSEFQIDENKKVSTTIIKEYLQDGNIVKANELLDKEYYISGKVLKGDQIGRTIDFPTINIKSHKFLPKFGVYKTKVEFLGKFYKGITNVGIRPTVEKHGEVVIETNILDDFTKEIYGEHVTIYFEDRIRDEKKFTNLDELKNQIKRDVQIAKGEE